MAHRFVNAWTITLTILVAPVLLLLLGLSAFVIFTEPTPWRDIPPGGIQGHGNDYDEAITELRIYRLPDRGYDFYFQDELVDVRPLFRTKDAGTIVRTLNATKENYGELGGPYHCGRTDKEAFHFITYRSDGSVFGYTVVNRGERNADAPAWIKDCAMMNYYDGGNHSGWPLYNLFTTLKVLGVDVDPG
ncbi:MAG: hypothetical protein OEN55_15855 [Alphaproteobacteria bacterium]|nr:hypothetical protein [Alphaproteobacteria bacterium]